MLIATPLAEACTSVSRPDPSTSERIALYCEQSNHSMPYSTNSVMSTMGFPLSETAAAQYVRPTVGPLERLKALVGRLFSHKFQCVTHRIHARFVQLVYRLLSVGVYGINDLPVKQPCRWREHIVLQKAHSLAAVFSRLQLLFAVNIAAASKMCSHVSYPMSVMLNHCLVAQIVYRRMTASAVVVFQSERVSDFVGYHQFQQLALQPFGQYRLAC